MKKPHSDRPKFVPRKILLDSKERMERAVLALQNVPIDEIRPLEIEIREQVKARKPDQNSLMWAGPLKDIAEQAWVDGRQFNAEIWHDYFRRAFLPDEFDAELCLPGYEKWTYDPAGDPVLVGSTKKLTVRGFSIYLEQVYAFGANLGVEFSAAPPKGF